MAEKEQLEQDVEVTRNQPMEDSYNTIRMRLDPAPMLTELTNILLGREIEEDEHGELVYVQNDDPWIDAKGVRKLIGNLRARLSVDKALSNVKDNEYNDILRGIGEMMLEFIMYNKAKYKIKETDFTMVFKIVMDNCKIFLSQARGGWHNELLSQGFQHRETTTRSDRSQIENLVPQKFSLIPGRSR